MYFIWSESKVKCPLNRKSSLHPQIAIELMFILWTITQWSVSNAVRIIMAEPIGLLGCFWEVITLYSHLKMMLSYFLEFSMTYPWTIKTLCLCTLSPSFSHLSVFSLPKTLHRITPITIVISVILAGWDDPLTYETQSSPYLFSLNVGTGPILVPQNTRGQTITFNKASLTFEDNEEVHDHRLTATTQAQLNLNSHRGQPQLYCSWYRSIIGFSKFKSHKQNLNLRESRILFL